MHARYGTMLRDLGRREDAIVEYRRAIALDDGQAIYHALVGTLLFDLAQNDAAMIEFRRALELDPKLAGDLDTTANSLINPASHVRSADMANANLIDACWMVVTASHLAPADVDYSPAMRRINGKLQGQHHCPSR
jgi:tetratricopeptide (TPR) repeat protein